MTNQQILEGDWNVIKGKLLKKWGQLTDGDLPQFSGDMDQLIGVLQSRRAKDARRLKRICKKCPPTPRRRSAGGDRNGAAPLCAARCPQGAAATTKRNALSAIGR